MGDLGAYRRKRDFAVTGEPRGDAAPGSAARFVIQEHHARRLHWDLRLERDGVLASWAVPKGLPEAPGSNHFAARTEDHPLEYIDFHGEIPRGQYGAGAMTIWDRGTYETLKWEARKVEVALHGERIDARYALFAIGDGDAPKDWMVHRMDPPADPAREPMPARLVPMLARPGRLPEDPGWAFEIRWPGERALAYSSPGELRIQAAGIQDITSLYPELGRLGRALGSHNAVLDGVVVALADGGGPRPPTLARRAAADRPAELRRLAARLPATYVIFDLLWLDGDSLVDLPYVDRRRRLESLALAGDRWRVLDHVVGQGPAVRATSAAHGLGGVVAKRLDSAYRPGRRVDTWIEVDTGVAAEVTPVLPPRGDRPSPTVRVGRRDLRLADLDEVLHTQAGTTRRDVLDYYTAIAPVLLAQLHGRAVPVTRSPRVDRPGWVRTAAPADGDRSLAYVLTDDLAALVWLADLVPFAIDAPPALAAAPGQPTAVVFDLEPCAPATVVDCCEVALRLDGVLGSLGLQTFAKTSGAGGLHVYLPLGAEHASFAETAAFARAVAELLARDDPERVAAPATVSPVPAGRVCVDWRRNDQHTATAAAYSLRAGERLAVSTPLDWPEVSAGLTCDRPDALVFDPAQVVDRLTDRGDIFAPVLFLNQALPHL